MHCTDWLPTVAAMAGVEMPSDREIDGKDQTPFLAGDQETSNRDGFIYWNGERMYGVKWQNFKFVFVKQEYLTDPAPPLGIFQIVNLITDPQERMPYTHNTMRHSWTAAHFFRLLGEFTESVKREPLIPAGAPLDHVPRAN